MLLVFRADALRGDRSALAGCGAGGGGTIGSVEDDDLEELPGAAAVACSWEDGRLFSTDLAGTALAVVCFPFRLEVTETAFKFL